MSKRPRPADPRQPDLFGPASPADAGVQAAARPHAAPRRPTRARQAAPDAAPALAHAPSVPALPPPGPDAAPTDAEPALAGSAAAVPQAPPPPGPPPRERVPPSAARNRARPEFRRVDPLGLRAADRPDAYLYCVATREVAERLLREGMPDEDPPALVERGAVPRHLAATAVELGWSDEQPGAIVVLRARRGELAQANAATPPVGRLRRLA